MEADNPTGEDTNVRVAVRCRPFNTKEKNNGEESCVKIFSDRVVLVDPKLGEEHSFAFDVVFDQDTLQTSVWESIGTPILTKAFNGYNGTIFAYGQTGSGKTWSMQGAEGELQGIIPRMNNCLFERISVEKENRPSMQFLVTVSYFEIYNEVIFDLLDANDRKKRGVGGSNKGGLEIKEHPVLGVYVKGLQEIVVENPQKLQDIIDQGMRSRTVASTQMNADSSRSHSVFTITIHQKDPEDEAKNVFAKVNLVDLAGSERVKSTGATGATLKEGANINKSLSELGNVINALVEKAKGKRGVFVPYRNSKLTRVLQESLGGNSITAMLAALSPAACNFDETLSTLKYANRAKAIKVNAVKNDEASQISRLNEEIRMLKERLASQPTGGDGRTTADTSALEERHKLQLKELEEAMRNTWEEKAKVSEEHERERKRLEKEQRAAARQLSATRERNWKLLEEKNDIDISLSHVRELSKRDPAVSSQLSAWITRLRDLTKLEQSLGEQDTVVQVYRSALERDSTTLLKSSGATPRVSTTSQRTLSQHVNPSASSTSGDKATLGPWRQLRDQFHAIVIEVQKWTKMQDSLLSAVDEFYGIVGGAQKTFRDRLASSGAKPAIQDTGGDSSRPETSTANPLSPEDAGEISRGLQLLRRQVKSKQKKLLHTIASTRAGLINFQSTSNDLVQSLKLYERLINDAVRVELQSIASSDGSSADAIAALKAQENEITGKLQRCAVLLTSTFTTAPAESPSGDQAAPSGSISARGRRPQGAREDEAIPPMEYRVECSSSSAIVVQIDEAQGEGGGDVANNKNAALDGNSSWCPSSSAKGDDAYLEAVLHRPRLLSALVVQGGYVAVAAAPSKNIGGHSVPEVKAKKPSSKAISAVVSPLAAPKILPQDITLPCGVSLVNCNGDIEATSAAVGDIMSWEALLKKNPPDKFLRRPPVRFMFDVFQFVGNSVAPGFMPETVCSSNWEAISASKQSKMEFMGVVISHLSTFLGVQPATTATNIVTGADAQLTCVLLQHLAISVQLYLARKNAAPAAVSADADTKETTSTKIHLESTASLIPPSSSEAAPSKIGLVAAWPTEVRILLSREGKTWSDPQTVTTGLNDATAKVTIPLSTLMAQSGSTGLKECRYVKIVGLKWASDDPASACMGAMRIGLRALLDDDTIPDTSPPVTGRSAAAGTNAPAASSKSIASKLIAADQVTVALDVMHETAEAMITAIEFVSKVEELRKARKQDEIRKQMEGLASEKQALEQRLANEQRALANEKQDLADQLRDAQLQLKEAHALLERERAIKAQLEQEQSQLEAEKTTLQTSLQGQMDELSSLKTDLLKLQANHEKDRLLVDTLRCQLAEGEQRISELTSEVEEGMQRRQQWETERDDLTSQIAVLTEERDAAHGNEESLFEQLTERTQDLERLQESYVDMTDRCNDAMDEISELREKMESYKDALMTSTSATALNASIAAADSKIRQSEDRNEGTASGRMESLSLPAIKAVRSPRSTQQSPRPQSDRRGINAVDQPKTTTLAKIDISSGQSMDSTEVHALPEPAPAATKHSTSKESKHTNNNSSGVIGSSGSDTTSFAPILPAIIPSTANGTKLKAIDPDEIDEKSPPVPQKEALQKSTSKATTSNTECDEYDDDFDDYGEDEFEDG